MLAIVRVAEEAKMENIVESSPYNPYWPSGQLNRHVWPLVSAQFWDISRHRQSNTMVAEFYERLSLWQDGYQICQY